jgi:hypothetical protein
MCDKLTNLIIPNSVTSLSGFVFATAYGLTTITLSNRLTKIPTYAFHYCSNLINITIPSSVITIEGLAFSNCSKLSNIIIPSSVTNIQNYAFQSCSVLSKITFNGPPPTIGYLVFTGVPSTINVYYPSIYSSNYTQTWFTTNFPNITVIQHII